MRGALLALALAAGCAHYDAMTYQALAEHARGRPAVTEESCREHEAAASALRSGPDAVLVVPLVGGGPALEQLADEHEVAAAVCRAAVQRELDASLQVRLLAAWDRLWALGLGEVQ